MALVAYGIFQASRKAPSAVILLALGVGAMFLIGYHTFSDPFLHETLWSSQEDVGRVDFVSIVGLWLA